MFSSSHKYKKKNLSAKHKNGGKSKIKFIIK